MQRAGARAGVSEGRFGEAKRATGLHEAWARMREALRIDRSWLDEDKDEADARRHGRPGMPAQSGPERLAVLERAWKVVDRFCMHLSNPDGLAGQPVLRVNRDSICA
jgi:hypothetical protein